MRQSGIILGSVLLLTSIFIGCGYGGGNGTTTTTTNAVAQVIVSPTGLSLNSGQVQQIIASPENSAGTAVAATPTFSTSNNKLVTVSPTGLVCAGVWDAQFINCNGLNSSGNPLSGSATITASAGGVTSAAIPITIHVQVTSVVVSQVTGCTSTTLTQQFTATACSSIATPPDTNGACAPNAKNVTNQIGSFTWGTINPSVASVNSTGLVTAGNPGFTGVFASASNTTSAPMPFTTCMPIEIRLHIQGQPNESATLTQNQAVTMESDMVDANGFTQNSLQTVMASTAPIVANIAGLSLSATSFGGAGISAACIPPTCGVGLNLPVYSNLFPVTVSATSTGPGKSPNPKVFVASSFTPPSGTSSMVFPIDTTAATPTLGTGVTLPGVPNSMVFSANGQVAYLGTNAGLVAFNPTGNAATLVDVTVLGKVLAVSPDGTIVVVSNAAADPQGHVIEPNPANQRLWIFQQPTGGAGSTATFIKPAAIAAAINVDKFRTYVATNDGTGNVYVFSPQLALQTVPTSNKAATDIATLPSGPFAFVADGNGLDVLATCNNVKQATKPTTNSNTLEFMKAVPNADRLIVVDSPGIDVETANVTSIFAGPHAVPFNFTVNNCQPNVSYSNQFVDFGVGTFTANQLLVATNGSEVAVLPAPLSNTAANASILTAALGTTPTVKVIALPAGSTQAFTGGMTPDGAQIWVGVGGTNTVEGIINGTNSVHVTTTFKQAAAGNPAAPPDILAVQPQ